MKRTSTPFLYHPLLYPDFTRCLFLSGMMLIFHFHVDGQQSNLTCNTNTAWVNTPFTVVENHSTTGLGCWEGSIGCPGPNTPANVINSNTSDFATGYITGVGSLTLSVRDNTNDYNGGDYAGFVVSSGLFSLGLFQSIQINTYLNGAPKETYQAVDLIGLSAGFLSGPIHIGFTTTMDFDEVEINIDNLLGVGSYNVYYAELESFCDGAPLGCNVQTPMNAPAYPMTIDYSQTGTSGVSVATVDNPLNAISASTTDFASLIHVANLLGSSFFTVEEEGTPYPVGTFVGFDIENTTVLGIGVFNFITITSYLNDVPQQTISGPALIAGAPLLSTSGRYTIGFVTNTMVDKVKITLAQPVNVTIGTTKIYSAIFEAFCEGDDPACNANTILTQPDYPVLIDMNETGLTGAACAGCNIFDPGNVIDASSTSFSLITITAGVATIGSIAVKDQLTDYPAGTFAAFRIENPTLVGANALTGITISTYLNGSFQEAQTNAGTLVSVNTDLVVNDDQQVVGFITTLPFDEIKISLYNVGSVDVGTTKVHEVILTAFCPTLIECDTTYFLNRPEFPVYIDAFRSGIFGAACAACAVTGEPNVITASNSDYALITIVAGAASFGSVAVADALYTYPAGTYAGFVIEDLGLLLEAQLFGTLTISTYNNGVLQEFKTGVDLIDLALIILFISDAPGRYNVGFKTTLPFDEIRISVGSLVSAINLVRVYGAFADTRASNGGDLFCNDAPLAIKDVVSTNEDNAVIIDVLANDVDSDDPIGIPSVTVNPDHGMVTVNADSTITYTPDPDYFGPDDFIYILCDPHGACDTAIVIINVIAVNDPPVANVDYVTTPEDMPVTTTVLANDSDVDNPLGTPMVTTPPAHGMVIVNGDGTITYTPAPNYNGPDSYIYTLCDPQPLCDTAIVRINVTPVNDAPIANVDYVTTPEDMPVTTPVLSNDSDPDNALGTPSVTTPPTHGMVTVNGDGTITYTPEPNYNGPDSYIYTLCDPQPLCDTAIVRINVSPVNDAPIANVDYVTTPEDMPVTTNVRANDSDIDNPLGNPTVTTPPAHGMTTVNGDGTITYTPAPNYNGPDSYIYTLCDPQPLCDTAIVRINVTPVNDAPIANVDYVTTPEDMPVTTNVRANDSDVDNPLGTPTVTTPPAHGMTTVNGDGTITYTPAPNYNGPDSYIYTLCDPQPLCDTAIVRITISPVNDPPIANKDMSTTPQDMPVTITVLANDSDVDNALGTPTVTTPPAHGTTMVNASGTITYTPNPGYNGPDSFIYTLCDPQPLCDTALVVISVTPVGPGNLSIICPGELVMECGSGNYVAQINAWIESVDAIGGCGGNLTITTNYDGSSVPPLSCNLSIGLAITFTATDQCGTSATCISNVFLDDTQSPILTPGEIDECYNTLAEAVDAAIDATQMSDNCASTGDLVITYALGDGPDCDTLITLTVSDACGNSASVTYQTRINCQVIRLKVWLEGPYDAMGDSMKTTMNELHTLPGQLNPSPFTTDEPNGQPYDVAPWNYNGNSGNNFGDGGGMTPYPADVVDWILVMVRHEGIQPANTIWTCAGWVHKNGNVTFPENCPPPPINPNDDYYFVVQHRNHLGILSPSFVNINCGGEVLEWDFRTSDSYRPIFRVGQKVLEPGVWGMFDSNGEQIQSIVAINSADRTLWVQWQGYSGYSPGDYDLNAFTDSFDETIWKNNQNRTTGVVFY